MSPTQYRAELRRLGLNQVAAAKLLGISPRTSRRYAAGHTKVHHALADKLRELQPADVNGAVSTYKRVRK